MATLCSTLAKRLILRTTTQQFVKHIQSYHTTPYTSGYTGIYLQPLPEDEIKIMQWMKSKEIKRRKEHMLKLSQQIWSEHNDVDYERITQSQCKHLLTQYLANEPTAWQVKQFYHNTLERYAAYRLFEEQQQRKQHVDKVIDEIISEIKDQVHKSRGTVELSKNDLTFKLEDKLGELPTADEVDLIWSLRYTVPLVKWMGSD